MTRRITTHNAIPEVHFMVFDHKEYVALPVEIVHQLTHEQWQEAIEDALTARIIQHHRAHPQETFPSAVAEALLEGANAVKIFREHRGLSQETLAEKAGLDRSYLSGIENGKRRPSKKTLIAIAQALAVDVEQLMMA